ncbi:MAG: ORF6N domain-containing protein [Planctomycetota bacterium]|nr:ORF6N domain-containing protein [Planctomycetota bacterium]
MPTDSSKEQPVVLLDQIESLIHTVRGQRVMFDRDLAKLYGVPTKRLNEQVRRNIARFPDDFRFQFTREESDSLRSQIATSKPGRGGRRTLPFAFTEHGAIMAANVLNSPRAVEVSVFVVRAFIRLREVALQHRELSQKLAELERKVDNHDDAIRQLVSAIRELMAPPPMKSTGKIGSHAGGKQ